MKEAVWQLPINGEINKDNTTALIISATSTPCYKTVPLLSLYNRREISLQNTTTRLLEWSEKTMAAAKTFFVLLLFPTENLIR